MIKPARLFADNRYAGIGKDGYRIQIMIAAKKQAKNGQAGRTRPSATATE